MAKRERFDLVVVGGGPAGATLATLVKKYAPERRVALLEKTPFPRHHVGESLLPGIVPVLKEMGVFEKIDAAGFPRKIGANYIWGRDREVWENDFNETNVEEMFRRYGGLPERFEYAWQVRRSRYDQILLEHARANGVEVREGWSATGIQESGERVTGVRASGPDGRKKALDAEFVADCSGQNGFLSRFRRIRDYNPALKNVAGYAYFKDARWKYTFNGHPDKTKIFVCSVADGWFWYIPIARDIVSIGFVTQVEHLKRGGRDLRALFFDELERCAEIRPLLRSARPIQDFEGTGQDFFSQSDWSYLNSAASGPGWLAAGDAAVFVDPILSTGVTLAHTGAHRAAYTLLTQWSEKDGAARERLWADYDGFCRESAAQYLALALFWYGNDRNAERWWAHAAEVMRATLPVPFSDKTSFVAVSAGLTRHFDRHCSVSDLLAEQVTRPEELPFHQSVLGGRASKARSAFKDDDVLAVAYPWREEFSFLPETGRGFLRPVKRLRFLKQDPSDPVRDALNPRRWVTRYHTALLSALDGRRSLAQAKREASSQGVPDWWLQGPALNFLEELRHQGVLAAGGAARRVTEAAA